MKVRVERTEIRDVVVVHNEFFRDARGFFTEVYRRDVFADAGLPTEFVQVNHSKSSEGVLRGLHFQWEPAMGKLMRVIAGSAFLVAVDIRVGSPTLGRWVGIELSEADGRQFWAPGGCARGFCVTSQSAEIEYLCTSVYSMSGESGVRWNDPDIGIHWPMQAPIVSEKDAKAQSLAAWLQSSNAAHFVY